MCPNTVHTGEPCVGNLHTGANIGSTRVHTVHTENGTMVFAGHMTLMCFSVTTVHMFHSNTHSICTDRAAASADLSSS